MGGVHKRGSIAWVFDLDIRRIPGLDTECMVYQRRVGKRIRVNVGDIK